MVATLQPAGMPSTNDLEPAIVENVASGNYTAIVRDVNGTTGIALVEVYALNERDAPNLISLSGPQR